MKITLSSNFNLTNLLSNLNIDSGFSIYRLDNNFSHKILKNVTDWFPKTYNIRTENVVALVKATNYINNYLGADFSKIIDIQLHASTEITKAYNKFQKTFNKVEDKKPESEMVYAQPSLNKISIGLDVFKKTSGDSLIGKLKNHLNIEIASRLVLFHELGHMLEYEKTPTVNTLNSIHYNKVEDNIEFLQNDQLKMFNHHLKQQRKNRRFSVLDTNFIELLHSLSQEIYADTASLLFERNYNIVEKTYSDENFYNLVNILNNTRKETYQQTKQIFFENLIDSVQATQLCLLHATHLTSLGLQDLKETIISTTKNWFPESDSLKMLNGNQIHQICKKQVQKGITKFIYILDKYIDVFQPQINTLINAKFNHIIGSLEACTSTSSDQVEINKSYFFSTLDKTWKNVVDKIFKNLPVCSLEQKILNVLEASVNLNTTNLKVINTEDNCLEDPLYKITEMRAKHNNHSSKPII